MFLESEYVTRAVWVADRSLLLDQLITKPINHSRNFSEWLIWLKKIIASSNLSAHRSHLLHLGQLSYLYPAWYVNTVRDETGNILECPTQSTADTPKIDSVDYKHHSQIIKSLKHNFGNPLHSPFSEREILFESATDWINEFYNTPYALNSVFKSSKLVLDEQERERLKEPYKDCQDFIYFCKSSLDAEVNLGEFDLPSTRLLLRRTL